MVSKLNTTVLVPYPSDPTFVGRSSILEKLRKQLGHGQDRPRGTAHSRAALFGLGGIGYAKINPCTHSNY